MKGLHLIAGVPRSGSTLLCNILNQNPKFSASDTSILPELFGVVTQKISNSAEIQGVLLSDPKGYDRIAGMYRGIVEAWYSDTDKVVFDKSRGWVFHALLMAELFPAAKFIVTVRDLRSVFASVEKQHRKTAIFDQAANANEKTIMSRADNMLSPDGMIGQCVTGLEDIMARSPEKVFVMNYENMTRDPRSAVTDLYEFLNLPEYKHNFTNVKNVSNEPDSLYLNKFPHEGSGKVKKTNRSEWKKFITPELGGMIHERYPGYNSLFGYQS